jgi:3'-phosphoadenosine 5'-phosphosulfate sulfotransferase (PAPS reductase)/FAD synthetase
MKETPARRFYKEYGIEGVVTGLRVVESLMRKLNFADYGALRYSSTYKTLISWPLYAWKNEDLEKYIKKHKLPLNPIYEMGYNRVGCWACLQDMFYKDSRLFTLQEQHPRLYSFVKERLGKEMTQLLVAWAELEEFGFTEEDFDSLYDRCSFETFYDANKKNKK